MTDPDLESNRDTGTPALDAGEGDLLAIPFWDSPVAVTGVDDNGAYTLRGPSDGTYRLRPTPQGYELTRTNPGEGGYQTDRLPAHVAAPDIDVLSPDSCIKRAEIPGHRKLYVGRALTGASVEVKSDGILVTETTVTKGGQVVCPRGSEGMTASVWLADDAA